MNEVNGAIRGESLVAMRPCYIILRLFMAQNHRFTPPHPQVTMLTIVALVLYCLVLLVNAQLCIGLHMQIVFLFGHTHIRCWLCDVGGFCSVLTWHQHIFKSRSIDSNRTTTLLDKRTMLYGTGPLRTRGHAQRNCPLILSKGQEGVYMRLLHMKEFFAHLDLISRLPFKIVSSFPSRCETPRAKENGQQINSERRREVRRMFIGR